MFLFIGECVRAAKAGIRVMVEYEEAGDEIYLYGKHGRKYSYFLISSLYLVN